MSGPAAETLARTSAGPPSRSWIAPVVLMPQTSASRTVRVVVPCAREKVPRTGFQTRFRYANEPREKRTSPRTASAGVVSSVGAEALPFLLLLPVENRRNALPREGVGRGVQVENEPFVPERRVAGDREALLVEDDGGRRRGEPVPRGAKVEALDRDVASRRGDQEILPGEPSVHRRLRGVLAPHEGAELALDPAVPLPPLGEHVFQGRAVQAAGEADFELALLQTEGDRGIGEMVGDRQAADVRPRLASDHVECHERAPPDRDLPRKRERASAAEPDAELLEREWRRRQETARKQGFLPDPPDRLGSHLAVHDGLESPKASPVAVERA